MGTGACGVTAQHTTIRLQILDANALVEVDGIRGDVGLLPLHLGAPAIDLEVLEVALPSSEEEVDEDKEGE